jgi:hypothetical protein
VSGCASRTNSGCALGALVASTVPLPTMRAIPSSATGDERSPPRSSPPLSGELAERGRPPASPQHASHDDERAKWRLQPGRTSYCLAEGTQHPRTDRERVLARVTKHLGLPPIQPSDWVRSLATRKSGSGVIPEHSPSRRRRQR